MGLFSRQTSELRDSLNALRGEELTEDERTSLADCDSAVNQIEGLLEHVALADVVDAPMPQPCGDRCIIRPSVEGDMTPGGLYKPDIAKEKPTRGIVLAVGEDLQPERVALGATSISAVMREKLLVGDEVLYGRYSGTEFVHEGETLLIVRYPDILAVYR